jgi:hypothetical protein
VGDKDAYTEHVKSNVYISAFITAYARLKLYEEALEPLGEKVLYFDTDSVIYCSPTGEHLVPVDTTGTLGLWTSEAPPDDYFVEFCAAGPKTYALRSMSGNNDIAKSKGFGMHYANQQVFNFEALKWQAIAKGMNVDLEKLVLHQNETVMRRNLFQVLVQNNPGKVLNMVYDKREIVWIDGSLIRPQEVTLVDTLPWGYATFSPEEEVELARLMEGVCEEKENKNGES